MHLGVITCELKPTHGWARYSVDVLAALHRAGVRLRVVTSGSSPTDYPFPVFPILPEAVPAPRFLPVRLGGCVPRAWAALRGVHLVHTLIEPFSHLGAVVARGRPHIISAHGTYAALPSIAHPLSRPVFARTFRRADAIICTSRYTESVLLRSVPQAHSVVIPNAVNAVEFAARVATAQPFEKSGEVVLFVGAVKPRKGVLELIQAFDTARRTRPNARCVIVGSLSDTAYVDTVRAEMTRRELGEYVTLTGRVSDDELMRWYRTADIFALPAINDGARFEGFGLVYLEASAVGLPVIGTRDCGAEQAIIDGQTGLLIPQHGVVEALAGALTHLLESPETRQRLGEHGRQFAAEQTWERAAQAFIAVYEDVLRGRRA